MIDKKALLQAFEIQIAAVLSVLKQAALAAHDAATHSESKAEDQYDTRGLEAAYLAGAQSKRAAELEELLAIFRHTDIRTFASDSKIASTALLELEDDGKRSLYLLMPKGGGLQATVDGRAVQVITPVSPLGEAVLGRVAGDSVQVEIARRTKDFDIVGVW